MRAPTATSVRYPRRVLVVTLAGMFATAFPVVILVASLGQIGDDLGGGESLLAWVVTAPLIASSVLMPVLGKVGDLRGHRRVFLVGFGSAAVISGMTALAWDPFSLIALRTLAQVTGAATQPTSLALIMDVFPPRERVRAMGYWSFVSGGAPALGLIAGGPLVDTVGWRSLFLIQGGLSLVALALAAVVLRETTAAHGDVDFDLRGAAALTLASGGALFALNRTGAWGVGHPAVIASAGLAVVAAVAFVRTEWRAAHPLLPLELVARRDFTAPVTSEFFMQSATMGAFTLVPLMLRSEFGYSVATSALVLLPLPVGMSVMSPVGGRLATIAGGRSSAVLGGVSLGVAMVVLALGAQHRVPGAVVVGLGLLGVANGLARPSLAAGAANAFHAGYFGVGVAAGRMLSQLGAAAGITLLVMVQESGSYSRALGVGVLLAGVALAAACAVRDYFGELGARMPPSTSSV